MSGVNYKLTQSVRTASGAKKLIRSLDQIIAETYSTANKYKGISKALTTLQKQLLIEDLQNNNTTLTEPDAQSIISDIRNSIQNMPIATVELAFQPSAYFTEEIADTINTMAKTPCIIEINHNPAIGGGLVIYFQGRHFDYSLSDKLNAISKV